ncbi:hypothetical protein QTP86_005119 [Hemibagrus guttatus]|nr:hypothetical protein QTP86_005119 [Hemibagrus guttatus]
MGMVCFLPGWSLISDTTASARISACLADISSWMTAHQLKLNPSKTELLIIPADPSPAQDLAISLSNSMISPSATAHNLGVTMDNQLSFSSHVTNVTRSCRFLLCNIRRIRPFLSTQATQVLVQSLVISRLDYCNSLLAGLPLNAIRPLPMIQNAAARLVFNLPKFFHTTPLLCSLHWLLVAACIRFKTLMLAYKAKNGPAPSYLKALITSRTAPRLLRSTSTARLVPPSLREKVLVFANPRLPYILHTDASMLGLSAALYQEQDGKLVCMDFLTLEPDRSNTTDVLVITDHFTIYALAIPTPNQKAKTVAKCLWEQFICHYGYPECLHSDQGRDFESHLIKELCDVAGVRKVRTTPYHPRGNPVERFNRTLLCMLGTLENKKKGCWKEHGDRETQFFVFYLGSSSRMKWMDMKKRRKSERERYCPWLGAEENRGETTGVGADLETGDEYTDTHGETRGMKNRGTAWWR